MAGTYPALEVSIAFGVASSDVPSGGDWVDVSNDVAYVETVTGRDDEFRQPAAGQLDLGLDNSTGAYDPDNTTGAHYGELLPLTWVRVKGGGATASSDVFYGQVSIEGFRVAASQFPGLVTVEVLDAIEQLANTELPSSVWAIEVAEDDPDGWWRLGESSGTVAWDSAGNRNLTYEGGATFNSRAGLIEGESDNAISFDGSAGQYAEGVFNSSVLTLGSMTVEFVVQGSGATIGTAVFIEGGVSTEYLALTINFNSGNMTVDWADDDGNFDSSNTIGSGVNLGDGEPHVVAFVYDTAVGDLRLFIDGFDQATTTANRTGKAMTMRRLRLGDFAATLDEVVLFTSALSNPRLAAHYASAAEPWASELTSDRAGHILDAVAYNATNRTISTGSSFVGPADLGGDDVASALLAVASSEGGHFYIDHADGGKVRVTSRRDRWTETRSLTSQATFGDGGGSEVPYAGLDIQDDRIINVVTVQRAHGAAVTVSDSASIALYQRRTYSESGLLYETDAESQYRAERIVAEKKDRHRRVRSMTLEPLEDADLAWAQVFARKIGDRITIKWQPPYGGTYSYECWIEGVRHRYDAAVGLLRTTFSLSPVPFDTTGAPYWILGTSTWETGTSVARWSY